MYNYNKSERCVRASVRACLRACISKRELGKFECLQRSAMTSKGCTTITNQRGVCVPACVRACVRECVRARACVCLRACARACVLARVHLKKGTQKVRVSAEERNVLEGMYNYNKSERCERSRTRNSIVAESRNVMYTLM